MPLTVANSRPSLGFQTRRAQTLSHHLEATKIEMATKSEMRALAKALQAVEACHR